MHNLIFVYNAESGWFNAIGDYFHKVFSPETYSCNLCGLTYNNLGQRKEWKDFVNSLALNTQFMYKDEFEQKYNIGEKTILPAVFYSNNESLVNLISAEELNNCANLNKLIWLIELKINKDNLL